MRFPPARCNNESEEGQAIPLSKSLLEAAQLGRGGADGYLCRNGQRGSRGPAGQGGRDGATPAAQHSCGVLPASSASLGLSGGFPVLLLFPC